MDNHAVYASKPDVDAAFVKRAAAARALPGGLIRPIKKTRIAEEIADRIGILNRGQLDFLGTLGQLRQELSAPQQALEHLFLELTNGHAHGAEELAS